MQKERQIITNNGKALLDLAEACQVTGISSWTLRKDVSTKKLACIRRGGNHGKILLSISDLEEYLRKYRVSAAE